MAATKRWCFPSGEVGAGRCCDVYLYHRKIWSFATRLWNFRFFFLLPMAATRHLPSPTPLSDGWKARMPKTRGAVQAIASILKQIVIVRMAFLWIEMTRQIGCVHATLIVVGAQYSVECIVAWCRRTNQQARPVKVVAVAIERPPPSRPKETPSTGWEEDTARRRRKRMARRRARETAPHAVDW